MMDTIVDMSADYIDVRDVIVRYEYLEDGDAQTLEPDEITEREIIADLLDNLSGNGGDEEWRGAWYPITLIRDSYFEDSARELADDMYGREMSEARWPFNCIDWERAADELRMNYTSTEIDGVTYWYR